MLSSQFEVVNGKLLVLVDDSAVAVRVAERKLCRGVAEVCRQLVPLCSLAFVLADEAGAVLIEVAKL